MVDTLTQTAPLTAADRCDRCGARALARVTLTSGFELLLCGHHTREHAARLRADGAQISMQVDGAEDTAAMHGQPG